MKDIRNEIAEWSASLREAQSARNELWPLDRLSEIHCEETAEWLLQAHAHVERVIANCESHIAELEAELFESAEYDECGIFGADSRDALIALVEMAEESALAELAEFGCIEFEEQVPWVELCVNAESNDALWAIAESEWMPFELF